MHRRHFLNITVGFAGLALTNRLVTAQSADEAATNHDDPEGAAEYFSALESSTHEPALYTLFDFLHPDSQAEITREAMIGWYQNEFHPLGPQPATATGVTMLDSWTWDVNGVAYEHVAEVSFRQEFSSAEPVEDVVRLVFVNDHWAWFFGRDKAFVDEQNEIYGPSEENQQDRPAPYGLDVLSTIPAESFTRIASSGVQVSAETTYEAELSENPPMFGWASSVKLLELRSPGSEYQEAAILLAELDEPLAPDELLLQANAELRTRSGYRLLGMSSAPPKGLPWAEFEVFGNDAIGNTTNLMLASEMAVLILSSMRADEVFHLAQAVLGNPYQG